MPKKVVEKNHAVKTALAEEFVHLILPRVMGGYTENLENIIEQLHASKKVVEGEGDTSEVDKLISRNEAIMDKILTGSPEKAIEDFYVSALVEEFTEEELEMAVLQERFTVKICNLSARADAVLKTSLGNPN